jgi:hypothetical protein
MTMESSPAASRARQATTKLTGVRRLLAAARENLRNPPRVFVSRAIVMFRGAADLMARDLPLAFADVADRTVQDGLTSAANDARQAINEYAADLESKVLPNATDAYAIGTANVEARYRAEELIDIPAATLLAIGERELQKAGRLRSDRLACRTTPAGTISAGGLAQRPRRPSETGRTAGGSPEDGGRTAGLHPRAAPRDLPEGERVVVAAAPAFDLGRRRCTRRRRSSRIR